LHFDRVVSGAKLVRSLDVTSWSHLKVPVVAVRIQLGSREPSTCEKSLAKRL
jgi:hypothetical protein